MPVGRTSTAKCCSTWHAVYGCLARTGAPHADLVMEEAIAVDAGQDQEQRARVRIRIRRQRRQRGPHTVRAQRQARARRDALARVAARRHRRAQLRHVLRARFPLHAHFPALPARLLGLLRTWHRKARHCRR